MTPSVYGFGLIAVMVGCACSDATAVAETAQAMATENEMSEDVRRMHERLTALSRGEGSIDSLRIEFMDGGMSAHRSFGLEAGKLVSKEWTSPGSEMVHREGRVTERRVTELLRELIDQRYWTFPGTRFFPDAPIFLFRFYYGDLKHVDFRCDHEELRGSPERSAIRDVFLELVADTEMKPVPEKQ
jgi:hypothetical protein